ncbi:hypothetical protein CTEN210_06835 [Chaetoceros tenuissimus]|uniref:Coenzyme Q-binding protein COQ10 START domain-containing protein n=1 Tax=Chaetoceros tenuissimus TaxID=426638 RepID=A0AAD3H573_9STRA|nr:hypothetical protein CTEN210_06835 [Chaetoceros tenuissimus]
MQFAMLLLALGILFISDTNGFAHSATVSFKGPISLNKKGSFPFFLASSSKNEDDTYDNLAITINEEQEEDYSLSNRELEVSASIVLPFEADTAFSAFTDLQRQPTWSTWLHSVTYIEDGLNQKTECGIPLKETKWTMQWKKAFRFSWKSKMTQLQRPSLIKWESTSGLKNYGQIEFNSLSEQDTEMKLTMKFIAPRIVASMMRRSDKIKHFMEENMLNPTLVNFRRIVLEQDLGIQNADEILKDFDSVDK